jgi:peroxiredoxin (alkyl hydroperoxide reductase subunit C)
MLQVQSPAPGFKEVAIMPNLETKVISLSDYIGKYVLLLFFPGSFSYVCPMELLAFSDSLDLFTAIDTVVLCASCDSEYVQMAFANTPCEEGGIAGIRFPVIADFSKRVATSYGLVLESGYPLRGMFIISDTGILKHITINDILVGRNVSEALRLIKAHKVVDESHGQLCTQVNWAPGQTPIQVHPVLYKDVSARILFAMYEDMTHNIRV